MGKVLFIYEREMPTVSSMREGFEGLFNGTTVKYRFVQNTDVTERDIYETDVLVIIRPHNYLTMKIAKKAKYTGSFIIMFMDDDMFNLPKALPSMPWRMYALEKNLGLSDVILSSSQHIIENYADLTSRKRGVVINTSVSENMILNIPKKVNDSNKVKIVYAAGRDHSVLFNEYILPILKDIDKKYSNRVSLTFVGVHPDFDISKYEIPIKFVPSMPLQEYRDYMREERFDIGLSPLQDSEFNKCKYFNKYIEYTLVGAVGIYSNCEPYTFVINNDNGLLANNTPDDWLESICALVDSRDKREQCLNNAVINLKNEFNVEKIRERLFMDIPELTETFEKEKCPSLVLDRLIYKVTRLLDTVYLTLFYLQTSGIKEVFRRIANHLRENKF